MVKRLLVTLLALLCIPSETQSPPPFRVDAVFDVVWAYPGQAVTYTVTAYSDTVRDVEFGLPAFEGFWQAGSRGFSGSATIDGKQYNTAIYQVSLFPQTVGRIELSATRVDFAETIFSEGASRLSNSTVLDVIELPPAPPEFSGLVGAVGALFTAEPAVVRIGEPIEVAFRLQGAANLAQLPPIELHLPDGWRIYPETTSAETDFDESILTQTRVLRWRAVPDRAGRAVLSVSPLGYFTLIDGFETLVIPEIAFEVLPGLNGEVSRESLTSALPSLSVLAPPQAGLGGVPGVLWGVAPAVAACAFAARIALRKARKVQAASRKRTALRRATARLRQIARSGKDVTLIDDAVRDYFTDHQWSVQTEPEAAEFLISVEDAHYNPAGNELVEGLSRRAAEMLRRLENGRPHAG